MIVTALLEQPWGSHSLLIAACSKPVDNLQQVMGTQVVDSLFADLLQVVRFLCV